MLFPIKRSIPSLILSTFTITTSLLPPSSTLTFAPVALYATTATATATTLHNNNIVVRGMCDDAKAFNDYVSASVELSDAHLDPNGLFSVIRSVRDIDQGKRRRYLYHIPLSSTTMSPLCSIPPTELCESILSRIPSPSGEKLAVFREEVWNECNKRKQVLEVWSNRGQSLQRRILLPEKKHGKVISDAANFGFPSWNEQETALVYVAERMAPETCGFFDKNYDDLQAEDTNGKGTYRGGKNTLGLGKTEGWGEKYFKQSALLDIFCVQVETGKVGKVENCPGAEAKTTEGSYALGQPVFSPDGLFVVYTAWDAGGGPSMPRRLGLIYCQQRPSKIYASPISKLMESLSSTDYGKSDKKEPDGASICLTLASRLATSPRFSPMDENGISKLVFLSSTDGFDTHSGVFELSSINWKEGKPEASSLRVLVDSVWDPKKSPAESGSCVGMLFPGLFMQQLPVKCFLSSDSLLATTQWGSCTRIVRISLRDGKVQVVNTVGMNHYSDSLLCVTPESGAVLMSSAPDQLPVLWHVDAPDLLLDSTVLGEKEKHRLTGMAPIAASKFSPVSLKPSLDFTCDINVLDDPPHVDGVKVGGVSVQTILLLPDRAKHPNPPLIVVPHGGPHSVSTAAYLPSSAYLCGYGGYAVAFVNYRGSTGFGQGLIASLPSRIGELDVADVIEATRKIQESGLVDPDRIGICGGSHGGFLTGHCTGRYPDLFRAAVMRNPVVNLCSMVTATDIPDWAFVETLGSYDWHEYRPPTPDEIHIMWEKSPIRYIQNVMCPTLVALGLADLRVPPSQGMEWFQTLRSNHVVTKLLLYDDDDHAIAGCQAESDHWVNIKRWFDAHL